MNVIKVQNLTKRYGDFTAVDHVSFEVEKGTLLGFLGVNGAGKTTVINMLATLLTPDEGRAELFGEVLGKGDVQIRKKIGIVYQQNCLDELLSVQENLIYRGILHGAGRKEAEHQCERLSRILKPEEILKKEYKTLSGGQKRRCEIAAALMHTPEILFLDEPTTGLDPATRLDVWSNIEELRRTERMTVFLTTHYMEEAAKADNIIIMNQGRIITSGTPFWLKEQYAMDKVKLYYKNGTSEVMQVASTLDALKLSLKDIYYFESVDNRVFSYTAKGMYEVHKKLYEIEAEYAHTDFLRISKSVIVNVAKIAYIKPIFNGRFEAKLKNEEKIIISRQYVLELKKKLEI